MGLQAQHTGVRQGGATAGQRLRSVDCLRGLAAFSILLLHVPHLRGVLSGSALLFLPIDLLGRGVPLFLVISGFCIHRSAALRLAAGQEPSRNWRGFWWRRWHRLYPPFVAAIFFGLLLLIPFSFAAGPIRDYLTDTRGLARDFLINLGMVNNFLEQTFAFGNQVFWSLALEEQLYVLYVAFLLLRRRIPVVSVSLAVLGVTLLWYAAGAASTILCPRVWMSQWPRWPFALWFVWTLGAVAAEAQGGGLRLPAWCFRGSVALVLAIAGCLLDPLVLHYARIDVLVTGLLGERHAVTLVMNGFWVPYRLGDCLWSVAFFIVLNRWTRAEGAGTFGGPVKNWFARLGIFSYSLYLTHVPVILAGERIFQAISGRHTILNIVARYALYVPLCLLIALGFFRLVERRFLNSTPAPGTVRTEASTRREAA